MEYCRFCMSKIGSGVTVCPVCGKRLDEEVPPHHLVPGTVLTGRYIVGAALGEGGFGITYVGLDNLFNEKVAIKEYYPNGYANRSNTISASVSLGTTADRIVFFDNGKKRFLGEAKTLARFNREDGVVHVIDFFEENSTAYIVMEYLEGETLKAYVGKKGRLTPDETLKLLIPVMESLEKVHEKGLIHRDISPDNIMLNNGEVKLLDFGAARTVSAQANKSLSVMLKPGYAPEEQYRSKGNQGPWTDVYAMCATLYKCITGITPDDATQRVYSDEVQAPSELGIDIKPHVEAAIMKGLAIRQQDRFQSMKELVKALQEDDNAAAVIPAAAGTAAAVAGTAAAAGAVAAASGTAAGAANASGYSGNTVTDLETELFEDTDPVTELAEDIDASTILSEPAIEETSSAGRNAPDHEKAKQNNKADEKNKKEKRFILIPIIGVLAAACIGLSIFLLSRGKTGDNGNEKKGSNDTIIADITDVPETTADSTLTAAPTQPAAVTSAPAATSAPIATSAPAATSAPTATSAPAATSVTERTSEPARTPTPTATRTPTPTPARTPTPTPTRTPTPTPTRTPTPTPTRTPTPTPTKKPTATPTEKPTATPATVPTMNPNAVPSQQMRYYNNHYYMIFHGSYNWSEAEAYCEKMNGHLVTITSQGEQNFIMSLNSSSECLWIGGYRISGNSWGWVTGETWSYTYWGEGEPNNSANVVSDENRACTFPMYWNDINENNLYEQDGFICEWDDDPCIGTYVDYFGLASKYTEYDDKESFIRPAVGVYNYEDRYYIKQGTPVYYLGWALFDDGLSFVYYELDGKQYKIDGPYRDRPDIGAYLYGRVSYNNGENAGIGEDGRFCELTAVKNLKKGSHSFALVAVSRFGNQREILSGYIIVE
ncbi:MAG: protein kinase [Clostridia bacterium]|nr:protein kinase [Clostridia bacterium]